MNRDDREGMVDRLLNEALEPPQVEPRNGLEQRIIANLRSQPEPQPWWTRRRAWLPAALAAAVILVIILKPTPSPQNVPVPVVIEHHTLPAPVQKQPAPLVVARQHKTPRRVPALSSVVNVRTAAAGPRQPVFAPARFTDAERALIAMLRSNPEEAKISLDRQEQGRQEQAEFMDQAFGQGR